MHVKKLGSELGIGASRYIRGKYLKHGIIVLYLQIANFLNFGIWQVKDVAVTFS